jgi:hypothetical protein
VFLYDLAFHFPLPLAGEGEGEGERSAHHPHLYPLPPTEGEEISGDIRDAMNRGKLLTVNGLVNKNDQV